MKPIILSTPEVRAILDGRKTQARKVIKLQPVLDDDGFWQWNGDVQWKHGGLGCPQSAIDDYAPYKPGDILYVREAWVKSNGTVVAEGFYYRANPEDAILVRRWNSSSSMPREAARIFLEVKSVRVERLHNISKDDERAEGIQNADCFPIVWDKYIANPGYGWDSNPWVWVIEFERRDKPE